MKTETKLIEIRVNDLMITEIEQIQKKIGAPSASDAVRRSVALAYILINYVEQGATIIVEKKDGEKRQITITGMK